MQVVCFFINPNLAMWQKEIVSLQVARDSRDLSCSFLPRLLIPCIQIYPDDRLIFDEYCISEEVSGSNPEEVHFLLNEFLNFACA